MTSALTSVYVLCRMLLAGIRTSRRIRRTLTTAHHGTGRVRLDLTGGWFRLSPLDDLCLNGAGRLRAAVMNGVDGDHGHASGLGLEFASSCSINVFSLFGRLHVARVAGDRSNL